MAKFSAMTWLWEVLDGKELEDSEDWLKNTSVLLPIVLAGAKLEEICIMSCFTKEQMWRSFEKIIGSEMMRERDEGNETMKQDFLLFKSPDLILQNSGDKQ